MADTGWLLFTNSIETSRSGADGDWSGASNILYDNSNHATSFNFGKNDYSDWLKVTEISGISIPIDSTIDGIELKLEDCRAEISNTFSESSIQLVLNGSESGDDKASSTDWSTSYIDKTYGGSSDVWNTSFDRDDIISSTFGFQLSIYCDGSVASDKGVDISCAKIKIYYTAPATMAQMMNHYKRLRA